MKKKKKNNYTSASAGSSLIVVGVVFKCTRALDFIDISIRYERPLLALFLKALIKL